MDPGSAPVRSAPCSRPARSSWRGRCPRRRLRGRLRLNFEIKPLLSAGILGLKGTQDLGEIQFVFQVEQKMHLVIHERQSRGDGGSGWSAPAARGEGSCVAACAGLLPRPFAITGIWAELQASVERCDRIDKRQAPRGCSQSKEVEFHKGLCKLSQWGKDNCHVARKVP